MNPLSSILLLLPLLLLLSATPSEASNLAQRVLLTDAAASSGALCLDGSPPAYYYRKGASSSKLLVYFQGGGWCTSVEDCYERSRTRLGSSSSYPPEQDLGFSECDSMFSGNASCSFMSDWTHVYIKYCDGGSYSGDNATLTAYGNATLAFRGSRVLDAVLDSLDEHLGLGSATDLVVSGCSAGGLAAYLHGDRVRARAPASARAVIMPDSGFFLDFPASYGAARTVFHNYTRALRWVYAQQNASVNAACVTAEASDPARCVFAQHVAPHIRTPVFALQSVTDAWQNPQEMGEPSSAPLVVRYGEQLAGALYTNLLATSTRNGGFVDSCYHHCRHWNQIAIDGTLSSQAARAFYNHATGAGPSAPGNRTVWQASVQYPSPDSCLPSGGR